ncbi:hypothetical protein GPECTOR_68g352 [Gonium pectorale]|uniref:RING-type domain-containing protein n=1 Tax=Gonium pectorale TaxID=33097 RepID=A0A150G3K7_GONPE|nr:hypothetical protein GPECTOR_68g352 [Gonium pectorale]|eukprot:KXZ44381.1 hypothetical protein GPECTOR_68g352 [Gonium pectorale]
MPETSQGEGGVEVVATRQDVIDLTEDRGHSDDDEVQITQVKVAKRPRQRSAGAAAAGPAALPPLSPPPAAQPAQPPPPPESPKGYKCIICLERMDQDLATTTCGWVDGHMFCYPCITSWVQKSGNCPQCRGKLTKTKIIRIYPPS